MQIAILAVFLPPASANAQIIVNGDSYRDTDDPFQSNRLIGIKERQHPELQSPGLDFAGLHVDPALTVSTGYDSNLLAIRNGIDDFRVTLRPKISANLEHSSFSLELDGWGAFNRHQRRRLENSDEYGLGFQVKTPLSPSYQIISGAEAGRYTEPRFAITAPRNRLRPNRYDQSRATIRLQQTRGRILFGTLLSAERLAFQPGERLDPSQKSQNSNGRSRDQIQLSSTIEYSFSPDTAIWGLIRANRKSHLADSLRNSTGLELAGGLRFFPTPLIRFTAALGYLEQKFQAPFRDVKGPTVEAQIHWMPTMLTSVTAGYSRKIEDRGSQAARDFFVSEMGVSIDHELRRNVILDFSVSMTNFDADDIGEENRRHGFAIGASFRPDRNWTIEGRFDYLNQNSTSPVRQFRRSFFSLSISVAA